MEILIYFIFNMIQLTGQHDWQDERLTGQILNQSRRWLLTIRYFKPCTSTPDTTSHTFDEKCVGSLRSHRIYNNYVLGL